MHISCEFSNLRRGAPARMQYPCMRYNFASCTDSLLQYISMTSFSFCGAQGYGFVMPIYLNHINYCGYWNKSEQYYRTNISKCVTYYIILFVSLILRISYTVYTNTKNGVSKYQVLITILYTLYFTHEYKSYNHAKEPSSFQKWLPSQNLFPVFSDEKMFRGLIFPNRLINLGGGALEWQTISPRFKSWM